MNKMKYLGERVLWGRNDRSQIVRRSQLNTSFYSWTAPYVEELVFYWRHNGDTSTTY